MFDFYKKVCYNGNAKPLKGVLKMIREEKLTKVMDYIPECVHTFGLQKIVTLNSKHY